MLPRSSLASQPAEIGVTSLFSVSPLPLIKGCNQQAVCFKECSSNSLSWPQHEPSTTPDEKHHNKHNFPSLFCLVRLTQRLSGYLPELRTPQLSPPSCSLPSLSLCCCSQTDRAVQLLLETSADNSSYYCDSLKACLVTTITSSGPSQSTIKLVATNMIANGKLAGSVCTVCLKASHICDHCQPHSLHRCLQP